MKKIKSLLVLGLIALVAFGGFMAFDSSKATAEDKKTTAVLKSEVPKDTKNTSSEVQQKQEGAKVIAYYFHGNVRCPTCMKLEEYSGEAVNQGFAEEIKKGSLEFIPLNVDQDANSHYIKDYALVSKALVLSKTVKGKEVKWKNLDMIWNLVRDHDKFIEYVRDETKKMIEEKS